MTMEDLENTIILNPWAQEYAFSIMIAMATWMLTFPRELLCQAGEKILYWKINFIEMMAQYGQTLQNKPGSVTGVIAWAVPVQIMTMTEPQIYMLQIMDRIFFIVTIMMVRLQTLHLMQVLITPIWA